MLSGATTEWLPGRGRITAATIARRDDRAKETAVNASRLEASHTLECRSFVGI
jgi:hypothetical protein